MHLHVSNGPLPSALQVGSNEELDEEKEVARVQQKGVPNTRVRNGTREILAQVSVGLDVEHNPGSHLADLQQRHKHGDLLGNPVAHGPEREVGVHEDVYDVVHDDDPAAVAGDHGAAEPAVDEDGDVVEDVEEGDVTLAQDEEYRVAQLDHFQHPEGPAPEGHHWAVQEAADVMKDNQSTK